MKIKQIFKFPEPRVKGRIINRYKRFLSDIALESGEIVQAHVPNSGSMQTCWLPDQPVILSDHSCNPARKLKYTLEAVKMPDGWVGVNTNNPNYAVKNAIEMGLIEKLAGYQFLLPEVKISSTSRLDLMLWSENSKLQIQNFVSKNRNPVQIPRPPNLNSQKSVCFVEIKNVTLLEKDGIISFPDAITKRGQKHLEELIKLKNQGFRSVILFFVERNSAKYMTTARDIDPEYDRLLREAISHHGVEAIAIKVIIKEDGLYLDSNLEIRL